MKTSTVPGGAPHIETILHDTQILVLRIGHRMQHGPKLPLSELRAIQECLELLADRTKGLERILRDRSSETRDHDTLSMPTEPLVM